MKSIDFLEHGASGERFGLLLGGESYWIADPREQHYQKVLASLHFRHALGTPPGIPWWQHRLIFDRWVAAYELPAIEDAKRLAYLVDHYRAGISSDLANLGYDLGALWRERRWQFLIDIIDRLPSNSWYASSVAMDEDHAKMLAESIAARPDSDRESAPNGPSLTSWTPEVALLTSVLDAVRRVEYATYAAQHGKKAGEPPSPMPRPVTALEKALKHAQYVRRKTQHESLAARLLPHKKAVKS